MQLAERPVSVYRFEQLWREGDRAAFAIECSAGTYVRSLIADLGDAYCEQLRRTAIGPFAIEDADPAALIGLREALSFMPCVALDADAARRAGHGQAVTADAPAGAAAVVLLDGAEPVAIAEPRAGALKPVVGFRA